MSSRRLLVSTLIGDLVASRKHPDRARLQKATRDTLTRINKLLRPVQALEPTLGDEFQGAFASVPDAIEASLVLRLELLSARDGSDSRYGIGWGEIQVFDRSRALISQDGPGWWAARSAIERAKEQARWSRAETGRTCFVSRLADGGSWSASMDAFLLMRDATVERMTDRQHRLLLGIVNGRTQEQIAKREGITQSAVSQSLHHCGALAIVSAQERMREDGRW